MDLIPQMIEIQKYRLDNEKSTQWYRSTTYLTEDSTLSRRCIGALRNGKVVQSSDRRLIRQQSKGESFIQSVLSVSYRWEESDHEIPGEKTFRIFDIDGSGKETSRVRDSIVQRVLKYVIHFGLPGFWIDKDCINQRDESEKQIAIQSMDLMYRFSRPVACLTTSIDTTYQAGMLSKLMLDRWVWQQGSIASIKLKRYVRVWKAQHIISMLNHLLSDPWWTRAWTYHEEFCASTKMILLVSYSRNVDCNQKFDFGNVPGEFELPAVQFREQLTRFCLAHMRKQGQQWQKGNEMCKEFLRIAGQYRLIDSYNKEVDAEYRTRALTWQVVEDLRSRGLENRWEILAIIANCCGYSVRLDANALKAHGYSLDAAVIVLLLLNGEILQHEDASHLSSQVNVVDLASQSSFRNFRSMVDVKEYTFLKRCRFADVSLCADGVLTRGYLWSLYEDVHVPLVRPFRKTQISFDDSTLSQDEIKQLHVLCKCIGHDHLGLANKIRELVKRVRREKIGEESRFMILMAKNIARSIQRKEIIMIGQLLQSRSGCGVFAVDFPAAHSFTSWQPMVKSGILKADRYLEKAISLDVEVVQTPSSIPRLTARRWIAGLWFVERGDPQQVLMPWPTTLQHQKCQPGFQEAA